MLSDLSSSRDKQCEENKTDLKKLSSLSKVTKLENCGEKIQTTVFLTPIFSQNLESIAKSQSLTVDERNDKMKLLSVSAQRTG